MAGSGTPSGGRGRRRGPAALDSVSARPPGPVRTCVGCRVRAAKSALLRVVVAGGVLTPDPSGRLPGRGAHVHPDPRCVDLAERRRAFPRALRLAGPLDATTVREYVEQREPFQHSTSPRREQVEKPHEPELDEHSMSHHS